VNTGRGYDVAVFAGGRGERLRPLSDERNKNLMPAGVKPIVGHVLDLIESVSPSRVFLLVGYRADDFRSYLETWRSSSAARIELAEKAACCPLHALLQLESEGLTDPFLLVHGNILFRAGLLTEVCQAHATHKSAVCVAGVSLNHLVETHPYSRMTDGRVTELRLERPADPRSWACWMGVYSLSTRLFGLMTQFGRCGVPESALAAALGPDSIRGVLYESRWFHLATREDLQAAKGMDTEWVWK